MNEKDFTNRIRQMVADYTNEHLDPTDGKRILPEDVYIVWQCKTLQNSKAMASTVLLDGMYYEVTYNGDKKQFYLTLTKKFENRCIQA